MKLQKFIKNKKQKQILIGAIIGIIILIGGITLYRTFALYKAEKSFDVIKGKVPYFQRQEEHGDEISFLKGAEPVIKGNLVPVVISDSGQVFKADINKKWYDYQNKKWANAVILAGEKTADYYSNGQEIKESDIESYFVWIPKYKYKIFNMEKYTDTNGPLNENAAQTIDIEFGITDTQDGKENECTTPNKSGADGNCHKDYWMTHPAFTSFGTNGFWVGKFETGYDGANSTADAQKDTNEPEKVIIKPNVYSWRGIIVKNAFDTSYNYQRELDSHMMKNTEWGAVAYLQHSKYGSEQSVRINNNGAYVTGYAAKQEPTIGYTATNISQNIYDVTTPKTNSTNTYNYNDSLSKVASTTGNYTGIYDMSGGAWEYLMGVTISNNNGILFVSSGFSTSTFPFTSGEDNSKYYDIYDYNTNNTAYNRRILGDATGELGPFGTKKYDVQHSAQVSSWYDDNAINYNVSYPWWTRGGAFNHGTNSGIFNWSTNTGEKKDFATFRIVLAPQ